MLLYQDQRLVRDELLHWQSTQKALSRIFQENLEISYRGKEQQSLGLRPQRLSEEGELLPLEHLPSRGNLAAIDTI